MNIPGTANRDLPDSTLHYVPFTYVGTVNAYSLENEADKDTTSYEHSLFIANYNVTHTVSWDEMCIRDRVLDCPHFQSQRVKKGVDKGGKRAK